MSCGQVPAGAIVLNETDSIQNAVNNASAGATFYLRPGVYKRQSVAPKANQVFIGDIGATMDGEGVTQFAFKGHNGSSWVNGVRVKNITITRYNPPAQNGAIWGGDDLTTSTSGWVLDGLVVCYNSNIGIRIGNSMQVLRSLLHHNGTINIGGVGTNVLVDGIESSYGNDAFANNPGFESGGSKFVKTNGLIVRNSHFHDNGGVGLWLDINNSNYLLENNRVEKNYREGICIEVSQGGIIRNNSVKGNGWPTDPYRPNGWLWDAGIGIHASNDVEVYGNNLDENFNGIVAIQQPRDIAHGDSYAPPGGFFVQNLNVHNNTVYQRTPPPAGEGCVAAGAVQDVPNDAIFTTRNNRWNNNTYYLGSNPLPFAWMNGYRTRSQWQGYGQDAASTFNA